MPAGELGSVINKSTTLPDKMTGRRSIMERLINYFSFLSSLLEERMREEEKGGKKRFARRKNRGWIRSTSATED